jgi:hypothetical protein
MPKLKQVRIVCCAKRDDEHKRMFFSIYAPFERNRAARIRKGRSGVREILLGVEVEVPLACEGYDFTLGQRGFGAGGFSWTGLLRVANHDIVLAAA